jgi:hypothetical protein
MRLRLCRRAMLKVHEWSARVTAAKTVLERGHGAPKQVIGPGSLPPVRIFHDPSVLTFYGFETSLLRHRQRKFRCRRRARSGHAKTGARRSRPETSCGRMRNRSVQCLEDGGCSSHPSSCHAAEHRRARHKNGAVPGWIAVVPFQLAVRTNIVAAATSRAAAETSPIRHSPPARPEPTLRPGIPSLRQILCRACFLSPGAMLPYLGSSSPQPQEPTTLFSASAPHCWRRVDNGSPLQPPLGGSHGFARQSPDRLVDVRRTVLDSFCVLPLN